MKQLELVRHVLANGCVLLREGGNHSVYLNPANNLQSMIGRHRELDNVMGRIICRQLAIPPIGK